MADRLLEQLEKLNLSDQEASSLPITLYNKGKGILLLYLHYSN